MTTSSAPPRWPTGIPDPAHERVDPHPGRVVGHLLGRPVQVTAADCRLWRRSHPDQGTGPESSVAFCLAWHQPTAPSPHRPTAVAPSSSRT